MKEYKVIHVEPFNLHEKSIEQVVNEHLTQLQKEYRLYQVIDISLEMTQEFTTKSFTIKTLVEKL